MELKTKIDVISRSCFKNVLTFYDINYISHVFVFYVKYDDRPFIITLIISFDRRIILHVNFFGRICGVGL